MSDSGSEAGESWWLQGESIVALVSRRGWRWDLPDGVARAPGPLLLTATRSSGSPHGPFLELAVSEPARLGSRFGWCRTLVVVDRPDVQRESRVRWGVPATLGRLEWRADDDVRRLTWLDRDLTVRGTVRRVALPWAISQRSLQRRGGDNVVVPSRARGLAHACLVRVDRPAGAAHDGALLDDDHGTDADPLAEALCGGHLGAVLTGLHSRWRPALPPTVVHLPRRSNARPEPALYEHVSSAG
jgi:hypothetical protein